MMEVRVILSQAQDHPQDKVNTHCGQELAELDEFPE